MTSPNNGDLTRYRLDNNLLDSLVKHIENIVVGKKQTQNMSYLSVTAQKNLSSSLQRSMSPNNILNMVFAIVDNAFQPLQSEGVINLQQGRNAYYDFAASGGSVGISDANKPYSEAVKYVLTYLYPEKNVTIFTYVDTAEGRITSPIVDLNSTDLINSFRYLSIDPRRVKDAVDLIGGSLNEGIQNQARDISSLHLLNQNDELLLTTGQQIGEFLIRAGQVLDPNNTTALLEEYGEKGVLYNNVNAYWPEINAQIKLGEGDVENPSFVRGVGNIIEGIVNPTPSNNHRWINTIIGQTEVFPEADNSNPTSKRSFEILQSEVDYNDYVDFRNEIKNSETVTKIIKEQLGFNKDKISPAALESLALAFQQTVLNMSVEDFYDYNSPFTESLNEQVFDLIAPQEEIRSLINQKSNYDVITNETGYDAVVSKLLGLDGLNIGDPETGEKLEITAPDEFKKHISEILRENLDVRMTVEEAGRQVLEKMGISPEGKLVPKLEYYTQQYVQKPYTTPGTTYTDPITGETFTETSEGERLERITEEPPVTENELGTSESYFHQSQIFQPLDILLQGRKRVQEEQKRFEESVKDNQQTVAQQYGLIPPMNVDADLLGGAPGLPGFRVTPTPVYTDEDVATVLANRYADRPELLQFLAPKLTSIADAFRLSQQPGSLTQESFGDFEYFTDTVTAGPEGYIQGMIDGKPNVLAPGTKVDVERSRVVNEYGEAVDDYTSSRTMFEMFEADRPKSIQEYISREASRLEKGFESSALFEEEQRRLEQERQAEDARQKRQFVSQPVSIFGRRRR